MTKLQLVVFVSGDPHWAELMVKRMPESEEWGPTQVQIRQRTVVPRLTRCCTR